MEKIMNFFKNKSVGYFIAAATALIAFIVAIVFFATYRNPDLATQMGNKAEGWVVDTIGIFLLAGALVEVVVLFFPQYRFIQLIAALMFGLAFAKDVCVIVDFFAGLANGVMYNGGNLELNMFFFVSLIIILAASVVPAFMGFYKHDEEATADMPVKGTAKIVKVSCGAAALLATILVSTIFAASLTNGATGKGSNGGGNQGGNEQKEKYDPKKDERMIAAANAVEYSFNPDPVIIKQQEAYAYKAADATEGVYFNQEYPGLKEGASSRSGHELVYLFEGIFSEGYHGGYGTYSAYLYLWDDGLMSGKSNNANFKGYWYNSSLEYGKNEAGEDVEDCVNMVCEEKNTNGSLKYENFKSIITDSVKGFYSRQGYVFLNPGWGGRSVVVSGYKYYPDVAMFIDTDGQDTFKVGDVFNRENIWAANRVIKNLNYNPIMDVDSVKWTYPEGMLDENNKFKAAGEYEIKAKWGNFEDSVKVTVSEAAAE